MNNIFKKTVDKLTLISVVMAVLLALSIAVTAIFGANYAATLDDSKTVTVTVNSNFHDDSKKFEAMQSACEKEFASLDLSYEYHGEMSGDDFEVVYMFDKDTKTADLVKAKENLEKTFDKNTADDGIWNGSFVTVATGSETLYTKLPTAYIVRAALAVALFAVLVFAYVTLRYGLNAAIVACVSTLLGAVMSAALVLLVRIPVTTSILYVSVISSLIAAVLTLFTLNKLRANEKEEEKASVADCVASKEVLTFAATLGVALVLVGAIATWSVRWFAIAMLLGLIVACAIALFFAPALYLPLKENADEKAAGVTKSGYVGAKGSAKKEKVEKALEAIETEESNE